MGAPATQAVPEPPAPAEYRVDELARVAGTTVRNVRAYQDRGLLPPPKRVGRVGIYSESHLGRLRLIGDLLGRGYSLANIAEMIASWEQGQDLSELLGLEVALIGGWSDAPDAPLDPAQLSELLGVGADSLVDQAVRAGLVERVGDRLRVVNLKMLEAAGILVQAGMPLEELLGIAATVSAAVDEIAAAFVGLVARNLFDSLPKPIPSGDVSRLAGLVRQIRPLSKLVVDAELAVAMERRIRAEMGEQFSREHEQGQAAAS